MSRIPPRKPITPTIVVWLGMLVGFVGLVMVILGLGGVAPFQFQMPGVGVNVQTTSAGLVVMVIGFAVALTPIGLAMWVDGRRYSHSAVSWNAK